MANILTIVFIITTVGIFAYFIYESLKNYKMSKLINQNLDKDNILDSISSSRLNPLVDSYKNSFSNISGKDIKCNYPSSEFFNEESISKCIKLNLKMLDTASGTLVGLGLLGTFVGLTFGVSNFDTESTEQIQASINSLLDGMGTAFYTSLVGMLLSLIFTSLDKRWKNKLSRSIHTLTEKLDAQYYIDDIELMKINQDKMASALYNTLKSDLQKQQSQLFEKLSYINEAGENVSFANAVREILTENSEQSKALKSFSTDLAIELNNGFDEVLSRQMQERILPLMESVDATTKVVIEHIDQMADTVASPASGMMNSVVDELKNSMAAIIDEFRTSLSNSATEQLESLAQQLGAASQTLSIFPVNLDNISNTLQVTIDEVKRAISEISNTSASANSTAMQQMQEQITFATGSISTAITEVKEVMSSITQSSQEQSNQMIEKLSSAAEQMGTFLNATISSLSSSVTNSINGIAENVTNQQADLIALQEGTTSQTKKLLEAFNEGLDRLEKMNDYVANTMNEFKQAQGEISTSTGNLRTISGDMKLATELFTKNQQDYAENIANLQKASQKGIDHVAEILRNSGQLSDEYVQKFEIIKSGLGDIFSQLQKGLAEYSRTVQTTTQQYLDQYSTSLTQTTDALASTIQQQNEVVEMLNETLSRKK